MSDESYQTRRMSDESYQTRRMSDESYQTRWMSDESYQTRQMSDESYQTRRMSDEYYQTRQMSDESYQTRWMSDECTKPGGCLMNVTVYTFLFLKEEASSKIQFLTHACAVVSRFLRVIHALFPVLRSRNRLDMAYLCGLVLKVCYE